MKMRSAVIWAAVVAVIVWAAVWGVVWLLAMLVPDSEAEKLGQIGDMFGAGSALFSGIAVAAVAVVLVFDSNERKKDLDHRELVAQKERLALRPYVVGHISTKDARLEKSEWIANQLSVTLLVKVSLTNQAQGDPALNVSLKLTADPGAAKTAAVPVALPLSAGEHDPSDVAISFSGDAAHEALGALESGGLHLRIFVRYESLNGTPWCSSVEYVLSAAQSRVRNILPKLRDRESGETVTASGGVGGGTLYYLDAVAKPGSWAQEPEARQADS